MRNKVNLIIMLQLQFIFSYFAYVILHEIGHCIVAILCGASITDFSIINRSMSFTGGQFDYIQLALLHISGILCPTIVCLCLASIRKTHFIYNVFLIFLGFQNVIAQGALQAWIVVPLLSIFDRASESDDVIKFIKVTGMTPLSVTILTSVFVIGFVVLMLKQKYVEVKEQVIYWRTNERSEDSKKQDNAKDK